MLQSRHVDHVLEDARAKTLGRDSGSEILSAAHPDSRAAAQVVRDALASTGLTREQLGDAAGVSKGKAAGWALGVTAPSLVHLVRLAASKPGLCEAIIRELAKLCASDRHVARPLPERVCHALQELGHVSHEATMALSDGVIDDQERRSIRREIQHARDVLSALERDVDAYTPKGR